MIVGAWAKREVCTSNFHDALLNFLGTPNTMQVDIQDDRRGQLWWLFLLLLWLGLCLNLFLYHEKLQKKKRKRKEEVTSNSSIQNRKKRAIFKIPHYLLCLFPHLLSASQSTRAHLVDKSKRGQRIRKERSSENA